MTWPGLGLPFTPNRFLANQRCCVRYKQTLQSQQKQTLCFVDFRSLEIYRITSELMSYAVRLCLFIMFFAVLGVGNQG